MGGKQEIILSGTSKTPTYDYDEDSGILSIYDGRKLIVEWVCEEGIESVEALIADFKRIIKVGVEIGKSEEQK